MKTVRIIVFYVLLPACFAACADDLTIQGFYKQLGDAFSKCNTEQIVDLLRSLDGSEIWSFGSGIGPVDADFLQCVAVDSVLMIKEDCRQKAVLDLSDKWHDAFCASPTNSSLIVRLLEDSKPAIRLIALRKIAGVSLMDLEVGRQLKRLSVADPYVRIVKKPIKVSYDHPSPPELGETDIEFPLRTIARQILLTKGYTVEYKAEIDAGEGVCYFAELWMSNPRRRGDIQEAISLLGPNGYGVKAIMELGESKKDSPVYRVFRQQLEK